MLLKILTVVVSLVLIYVAISFANPDLGNQITNLITFNFDALDWSKVTW